MLEDFRNFYWLNYSNGYLLQFHISYSVNFIVCNCPLHLSFKKHWHQVNNIFLSHLFLQHLQHYYPLFPLPNLVWLYYLFLPWWALIELILLILHYLRINWLIWIHNIICCFIIFSVLLFSFCFPIFLSFTFFHIKPIHFLLVLL